MTIPTAGNRVSVADQRLTASPFTDAPMAAYCWRVTALLIVG